jgi:predicted ArsR family transcriptional regulator
VIEALTAINTARLTLDDAEHLAVALARSGGTTWQEIADALGISRQAAHERFSRDIV